MTRFLCFCFCLLTTVPLLAQSSYTLLIFHKLAPGKTLEDAMPVEREWKAINQAAVDEGNLIGWHMLIRQPASPKPEHADYDYVTCIVTATKAMKGASPAAMAKLYGDSVQVRMAGLQRRDKLTAPVIKVEWFENTDALVGAKFNPAKTKLITVDFLKLDEANGDQASALTATKKAAILRLNRGNYSGWAFSTLMPGTAKASYSHAVAHASANLKRANDQIIKSPFTVVRHDTFRFGQFTVRPGYER